MKKTACLCASVLVLLAAGVARADALPAIEPLVRAVDLDVGQSADVVLCDGSKATVKLISIEEQRDSVREALRGAVVTVEVDGQRVALPCATYHLPRTVGRVQIDCPVVQGYVQSKSRDKANPWSLDADARLRLWPAGSPWIRPGTFECPLRQRWFATMTQMSNELADDSLHLRRVYYYHWGLDFGGAERLEDVRAATDGVVVSAAGKLLGKGPYPPMLTPRYDVVYLRDGRGWYYRYSHLDSIDPNIQLGRRVERGQRIGALGKEGASGGWSHLHFDLIRPQPSGRYGQDDAYAFAWQAYQAWRPTPLVAVARPHQLAWTGQEVTLDGSRSYSADGPAGLRYDWTLSDGTAASGPAATRVYGAPGTYSEILKVSDAAGRVDYDFATVHVIDRDHPKNSPPWIHAAYWPTLGIQPGDEVTFKVRTFLVRPDEGRETWDFGDGSPAVSTQSDGNQDARAKDGYAVTKHRYARPGHYLVRVQRTNDRGETATDRLEIRVGQE